MSKDVFIVEYVLKCGHKDKVFFKSKSEIESFIEGLGDPGRGKYIKTVNWNGYIYDEDNKRVGVGRIIYVDQIAQISYYDIQMIDEIYNKIFWLINWNKAKELEITERS